MKRKHNGVSRRKFIKHALAGTAVLTAASVFKTVPFLHKNVFLAVDKDGNATLKGMTVIVDENNNAAIRKG